jgi:hypothetical protein
MHPNPTSFVKNINRNFQKFFDSVVLISDDMLINPNNAARYIGHRLDIYNRLVCNSFKHKHGYTENMF